MSRRPPVFGAERTRHGEAVTPSWRARRALVTTLAVVLVASQVMWGGAVGAPSAHGGDIAGNAGASAFDPFAGTSYDDLFGDGSDSDGDGDDEAPGAEVPEVLVPPVTVPGDYSIVVILPADPRRTAPAAPTNPYGPNCREVTSGV